jgi:hypothetical protein
MTNLHRKSDYTCKVCRCPPHDAEPSRYARCVKNTLFVDEFGFLNFFGSLPVRRDDNVPWIYNDSAKNNQACEFAIPAVPRAKGISRQLSAPYICANFRLAGDSPGVDSRRQMTR